MKIYKWALILLLLIVTSNLLSPETIGHAAMLPAVQSLALNPISISTQSGATVGSVASLKILDQSGILNDPTKYVVFSTPGTVYQDYHSYRLPTTEIRSAITSIRIRVNFNGPAQSLQTWSWYLFDWDASSWVVAGNNSGATANTWTVLTLGATLKNGARFINKSTGELRVQFMSNNASGDARLDFEALLINYNLTPPTTLLRGLAYSPYRDCQSPDTTSQPTLANITQDLEIIRGMSNGVRTYASTGINAQIPALARSMGLRVSAGAWLGKDLAANEREIQGLIAIANSVDLESVIVGNEVTLRGDLTEDQLIAYIQRVKNAVHVPVTTAEIGSILLQHSRIMNAVDYEMIHLYPFWDGKPIENAAQSVVDQYHAIQAQSGGRRVVIGETGWPAGGPANLQAIPSPANQYRFATEFLTLAVKENVEFYYFDIFDEMWKTRERGVGQYWGLWRSNRTAKYAIPSVMIPYASDMAASLTNPSLETTPSENLADSPNFFVYTDSFFPQNHFSPAKMGDLTKLNFNTCIVDAARWPKTSIAISYNPSISDPNGWAGTYWLQPDRNWGMVPNAGYNLTAYRQLIFQARAVESDTLVKFFVGGVSKDTIGNPLPYPSSITEQVFAQEANPNNGYINLSNTWRDYHIDLTNADLSRVIDGFGFSFERMRTPTKKTFYLDNIRFVTTMPDVIPFRVYQGETLARGLDMGVNTSGNQTNWVENMHGYMKASYPAGQTWGAIFITVGKPTQPGLRQSLNLSRHRFLRVELRGKKGGEKVSIGIKDKSQPDDGSEIKKPVTLTTTWTTYTFDLQSFAGADRTKIYIPIEFVFEPTTGAETIYFQNVVYVP